jgi:hypothetical protein
MGEEPWVNYINIDRRRLACDHVVYMQQCQRIFLLETSLATQGSRGFRKFYDSGYYWAGCL